MTPAKPQSCAEAAPVSELKFTLVVPTLREAGNLPELLLRVLASLDSVPVRSEVIVVDDDSGDGTAELVDRVARMDRRVRLLVRTGERGLAGAVLHGWRHCDGTLLGVMDADLQHPPELLPELLAAVMSGADLAVASRYKCGGSTGQWNLARRFVSNSATWLTRPLLPGRVKDPMSGFFIVQRELVEGLLLQTSGFKLLLELLVRAQITNVAEISFAFGTRHCGKSKADFSVAREYARLLFRLYMEQQTGAASPAIPRAAQAMAPPEFALAADSSEEIAVPELSSLVLQ